MFIVGLIGFAGASALGGLAVTRPCSSGPARCKAPSQLSWRLPLVDPDDHVPGRPLRASQGFRCLRRRLGAGGAVGVLGGGLLTQYASWRWCLLVNVPIAIAAAVAATRTVHESRAGAKTRYDVPGALLSTLGLVSLVYGFTKAESTGGAPRRLSCSRGGRCPSDRVHPGRVRLHPSAAAVEGRARSQSAAPSWRRCSPEPGCSPCSCSSATTSSKFCTTRRSGRVWPSCPSLWHNPRGRGVDDIGAPHRRPGANDTRSSHRCRRLAGLRRSVCTPLSGLTCSLRDPHERRLGLAFPPLSSTALIRVRDQDSGWRARS